MTIILSCDNDTPLWPTGRSVLKKWLVLHITHHCSFGNPMSFPLDDNFEELVNSFHFPSSSVLRSYMKTMGAIISGSGALALLHPGTFSPNDLDFYVLPNGYSLLLAFILNHGYVVEPDRDLCLAYKWDTILVLKLVNLESNKEINITILAAHVVYGITVFHSTLVMNYVAWYARGIWNVEKIPGSVNFFKPWCSWGPPPLWEKHTQNGNFQENHNPYKVVLMSHMYNSTEELFLPHMCHGDHR